MGFSLGSKAKWNNADVCWDELANRTKWAHELKSI